MTVRNKSVAHRCNGHFEAKRLVPATARKWTQVLPTARSALGDDLKEERPSAIGLVQTGHDFFVVREATRRRLRECEPTINPDFERATARPTKTYVCRRSRL